MKNFFIISLILIFSTSSYANKNKNTWDYPLRDYEGWVVKESENHYKFKSNLRQDKNVLKEFKNNKTKRWKWNRTWLWNCDIYGRGFVKEKPSSY